MNNYSVSTASYNGSSSDLNPLVMVQGTFNSAYANCLLFWDQIQQNNNFGGAQAVQALIAVGFQNYSKLGAGSATPNLPAPTVPASTSPAPLNSDVGYAKSVCQEALVGSWSQ
jgi:hypothetical protein